VPQLLITDDPNAQPATADTWLIQLIAEKDAEAFIGPFVLDRTHPLTEGLNLAGIVWGAGSGRESPGRPVVLAGGVPLVTDTENLTGQHHVRVRLRPDRSTLLESPAWPIMIWNLVHWRSSELPGLRRANVRLGEMLQLMTPRGLESVTYVPPAGSTRIVPVQNQRASVRPQLAGEHAFEAGTVRHRFAVNILRADESDLTGCISGRWGAWTEDAAAAPAVYNFAWILLLLALGVLTLHMFFAGRAGK